MPGFFAEKRAPDANAAWFGATLRQLVERKVAVQMLYSGSLHVSDRGRDQLGPFGREPFTQSLQYAFMGEVDHTVCTERGQQLFLQTVGDWVADRCFGTSAERRSPNRPLANAAGAERALPGTSGTSGPSGTWAAP